MKNFLTLGFSMAGLKECFSKRAMISVIANLIAWVLFPYLFSLIVGYYGWIATMPEWIAVALSGYMGHVVGTLLH
jgi:hypothetical protein